MQQNNTVKNELIERIITINRAWKISKAFRGELAPQDPNDEPADKLLERIKTARLEAEKLEKSAKKAAKVNAKKNKGI